MSKKYLRQIIDGLCESAEPHLGRDTDGIAATRERLLRDAVDVSPDGEVIYLRGGGEYHTHLCQCHVCEVEE